MRVGSGNMSRELGYREWQTIASEFNNSTTDGILLCLSLAGDIKESDGSTDDKSVCLEKIKEQLVAMVKMEREIEHITSAMQHVDNIATDIQTAEEPPGLLEAMDNKMKSLIEENFDPNTHSSIQDFDQIISGETAIDNNNIDNNEDVQFEKVQVSLKCPLTGCYLEDPVSNIECGHTYSRAAVMRHIQHRAKRAAKCPVCSGPLSQSNLKPEPGLAEKVRRVQRRGSIRPQASVVTL